MKQTVSNDKGKGIGISLSVLAGIFFCISLSFSISLQSSSNVEQTNSLNTYVLLITLLLAIVGVLFQNHPKFSLYLYMKFATPIFGLISCLYSLFFIFDIKIGELSVDNNTNFMCIIFFWIYTYIHTCFLCEWWDKQKDSLKKYILLILIELPNLFSWWVLAFSAPMYYVEDIHSPGHFWMTLFFALTVVFSLTGLRLYKASKQKAIIINDSL